MMRRLPRWRTIAGIAILSVAVATIPGYALTNAAWTEREFDVATVTALQCAGNTDLSSRATSRFLYGTVGGLPLDSVAGVTGIVSTNNGTTQTPVAGTPGASAAGTGYAAPLSASAINAAVLAGTSLSFPLTWPTGVYQQYARALDTGLSNSASGAVSNSGAIDTGAPGLSPGVGSLSLTTLPGIGTALGGLATVAVEVGAVASSASLDGCSYAWTGGTPTPVQLNRQYLLSSLRVNATSPTVAALFTTAGSVTNLVRADVTGEFGTNLTSGEAETAISASGLGALSASVTTGLLSPLLNTLNGTLGLLGVSLGVNGSSPLQAASTIVSVDLAPVVTLLTSSYNDGFVTVNLATGAITVDVAALSGGLNSRPANTELLTDAELVQVVNRVNAILEGRISAIRAALTTALESATVSVDLTVALKAGTVDVLSVRVGYAGTLQQFVDGTATTPLVTVTGPQITVLGSGAVQTILNNVGITTLLGGILGTVSSVTTTVLDTAQAQAFDELLGTQLDSVLTAANGLEDAALVVLAPLLADLGTLLSLTLNAQPDKANAVGTPSASPQSDEYFVSALRVGVLNGATSLLNVWLATSSVGANAT